MGNKQRGAETDQAAGEDIGRIVGTDEDAAGTDDECRGEEDAAGDAVEQIEREGDAEGGARMVAGEGGVMRTTASHVRRWMRREGSLAAPDLSDQLVDQKRQRHSGERARGRELPPTVAARSGGSQSAKVAIAITGTPHVSSTLSSRPSQRALARRQRVAVPSDHGLGSREALEPRWSFAAAQRNNTPVSLHLRSWAAPQGRQP